MPVGYDLWRVLCLFLMSDSYLPILGLSPSVAVLINNLHRAVGRYVLRVNIRYVHVHTSANDLPSTGLFFPPPSQQAVTVLLEF